MSRFRIGLVSMLLLTACSSQRENQRHYYQLPLMTPPVTARAATSSTERHQLWVQEVTVPDFLSGEELVYQDSDVHYTLAQHNLWASPLPQQLQHSLIVQLAAALPGWVVADQAQGSEPARLNVTITAFHGRYQGQAVISGTWQLTWRDRVYKQPFNVALTQPEDGYPALVRTLALAWQYVLTQMSARLTTLLAAEPLTGATGVTLLPAR